MLSPLLPDKVSTLVSVILNIKVFSVPDRLARFQTISVTLVPSNTNKIFDEILNIYSLTDLDVSWYQIGCKG